MPGIRKLGPNMQEYRTEEIAVTWEPKLCEHAAECIANLPEVFNARARPWIKLWKADAAEVARVVALCPSGAIKFQMPPSPLPEGEES